MEIVCVNKTMQNQTGNKTKEGRERKKTKTCQNETHAPNQDFFAIKYEKFQCKQLVCFYHVYIVKRFKIHLQIITHLFLAVSRSKGKSTKKCCEHINKTFTAQPNNWV